MPPKTGAILYVPAGISGVAVDGGATLGPVEFQFPESVFVTGVKLLTRSGLPADVAALALRIEDETAHDMFADGQGGSFFAPGAALGALTFRFWALQRPIQAGDVWRLSVQNRGAGPITPIVIVVFERGAREAA